MAEEGAIPEPQPGEPQPPESSPAPGEGTPAPEQPRKFPPENIKVIYFNVKALAEPLRYLLSYGNIEFDDVRISRDEWPALKATMPMGQMPVLEVDGKRVHQTLSMARYLAKVVKLNGKDEWEDLQIDIAADTVNDFRLKIAVVSYEPEDDIQEKKLQTLNQEVIPFYLEKLDNISKENNGYLAVGRLTWADVYLAGILDYLNYLTKRDLVAEWPNLKQVIENVHANENIKKWIESRPLTEV